MISFVIPTYKNKEHLLLNLTHNMPHFKNNEVIIVNDYPDEDLTKNLEKYKKITLLQNDRNLGFGLTVNKGVAAAKSQHVILLNSDVLLHDLSYEQAVEHFNKDSLLFAVSFAQKEKDNTIVGKNRIFWKNGLFRHEKARTTNFGSNGWAEGGTCMIDREKFMKLHGFSELFAPFYWEDIDLSYRAWKQGYSVVFDPEIVVEHHHESTIGKHFKNSYIQTISYRNQFIFIWKNITDPQLILSHWLYFLPNLLYFLLKGEFEFFKGLLLATTKIFSLLTEIKRQRPIVNDKIVLHKFYE